VYIRFEIGHCRHALYFNVSGNSLRTMTTLENNWKQKSIENLEKDFWGKPPKDSTSLVEKLHRLRAIQIEKLEPKDIRLLIGQHVGLQYLVPLALDILSNDLFTDTELYQGDLLQNVIRVNKEFWDNNKDLRDQLDVLLKSFTDDDKEKFKKGKFGEWT
jgi:hypothetical protein